MYLSRSMPSSTCSTSCKVCSSRPSTPLRQRISSIRWSSTNWWPGQLLCSCTGALVPLCFHRKYFHFYAYEAAYLCKIKWLTGEAHLVSLVDGDLHATVPSLHTISLKYWCEIIININNICASPTMAVQNISCKNSLCWYHVSAFYTDTCQFKWVTHIRFSKKCHSNLIPHRESEIFDIIKI